MLVLAFEIMEQVTRPFGLEINWNKSKIQYTLDQQLATTMNIQVNGNGVELVNSFTYLGSKVHGTESSEPEIRRRISIARECMKALDKNIWRSSITLDTKLRLHNAHIIPVLFYGVETWTVILAMQKKLNISDQWCLRRILKIPMQVHFTNWEV